jgi:hypothetical protein
VAGSCGSSPSSPNALLPFTTRADRMPRLQHAVITVHVFYRAGRDSDAVRAWRAGRCRARPATRTKRPSISQQQGFETSSAGANATTRRPSRSP